MAGQLAQVIQGVDKVEAALALAGLLGYVINSFPKEEKQQGFKELVRVMGNQIT